MSEKKKSVGILYVEDDVVDRMAFSRLAGEKHLHLSCDIAESYDQAQRLLDENDYQVVISDFHLGDGNALQLLDRAGETPFIITTGTGDEGLAVQAMKSGAFDYMIKDPERNYLKMLPLTVEAAIKHHQANVALQESEYRFKIMADSAPVLIWTARLDGEFDYFNKVWLDFTGRALEQEKGRGWQDSLHPEDRDSYSIQYENAFGKKAPFQLEFRLKRFDGKYCWLLNNGTPRINSDGSFAGYIGSCVDINDRKLAEDALAEREAELRAMNDASPFGIYVTDNSGNCRYTNAKYQELSGLTGEECLGDGWVKAIYKDDQERVASAWYESALHNTPFESLHRFKTPGGLIRWCNVKAAPIMQHNVIRGYVGSVEDVSEKKKAAEALQVALSAAENASAARSQFLANMSHEIRTPLTAIMGYADAGLNGMFSEQEQLHAFKVILSNSKDLLSMINDVLDLSKIDAGALTIEQIPLSPKEVLDSIRVLMAPRVQEKNLILQVQYDSDMPLVITSDPLRLKQVLINLIGNAIKFTSKGAVTVSVSCDAEEELMYFAISDTGVGMTDEQLAKIFKPFIQADESTTRKFGGTGLGLSISKKLVTALGGDIEVSSVIGEGSTFKFSIATGVLSDVPRVGDGNKVGHTEVVKTLSVESALKGRVLIADDAVDNLNLLQFTLRASGLELHCVTNGLEAVEAALTSPFDLILLDMQMPVMDGYTAASELRSCGVDIPIVAFTANAMQKDILACIEAGCDTYLSKPFKQSELMQCLSTQLEDRRTKKIRRTPIVSTRFLEDIEAIDLVCDFVNGLGLHLDALSDALCNRALSEVAEQSHRLAGIAGLYGYPLLAQGAAEIESAIKNKESSGCEEILNNMRETHLSIIDGVALMREKAEQGGFAAH